MCRAYNRWLADYCKPYPDRLFGVAMLPLQDVGLAIDEMRFARKELGFGAGFAAQSIRRQDDQSSRFRAVLGCCGKPRFFHRLPRGRVERHATVGVDRFEGLAREHIIFAYDGDDVGLPRGHLGRRLRAAPEDPYRFPRIGGGWIAPWLDRMDRHFDDQGFNDSGLKTRPSELFQRNCWISFEPVEGSLKVLADYVGPNKIMWATDYPHPTASSRAHPT